MPIYEYYCTECGHEFEAMQKITEEPLDKCESCGANKAKRAISQSTFMLKGSGWYVTDYAGKKPSGTGKTDTSSADTSSAPKSSAPSGA